MARPVMLAVNSDPQVPRELRRNGARLLGKLELRGASITLNSRRDMLRRSPAGREKDHR
jgi:hypothetical protein